MKRTLKPLVLVTLVGILLTYAGCGKKHETIVPVTDTQIDALSKNTWKVSTVTVDGNAPTVSYTGFTIAFSGTHGSTSINYTTTGRPTPSPWPASGTMDFVTATPTTNLTRNDPGADAVAIVYSLSATQLILKFQYNGDGFAGREAHTDQVDGQWVFTLVPA